MPSSNPLQRLIEIRDNIEAARDFVADLSLAQAVKDRKTWYAVIRALEIISEASRRLPDDLKARHPAINWVGMAAAGNVYRHTYDTVAPELVWQTLIHDLPALDAVVRTEIARVGKESPSP